MITQQAEPSQGGSVGFRGFHAFLICEALAWGAGGRSEGRGEVVVGEGGDGAGGGGGVRGGGRSEGWRAVVVGEE